MPAAVERQIRLLATYAAFTYPFACVPFLYFYFHEHGISFGDYLRLISIYYTTMIAAEVPTGFLADRYGRVLSAILGPAFLGASFLIIGTSSTFAAFAVGQAAMGIGHSLLSGPPAAILFENLRAAKRTDEYLKTEASLHSIRLWGTGVSFLLGGLVAQWFGFRACVLFTAPLCFVASFAAMCLRAPRRASASKRRVPIVISAIRDLRVPAVAWLVAYYVVLFCLLRYPFHLYQPFLKESGDDIPWRVGLLFFALNAVAAPASKWTPRLTAAIGERATFWLLPLVLAGSMWAMAGQFSALGIALFFVHQAPFGMHWSLIQSFANHRLRDASRATVLSALSFFGRLAFVGFLELTRYAVEGDSTGDAVANILRFAGIGGLIAITICMFAGRRVVGR